MEIGSEISRGLDILKSIKKTEATEKPLEANPSAPKLEQKKRFNKKVKNFTKERLSGLPEAITEATDA